MPLTEPTQGGVARNEPDDADLLAGVADGDRGALEELYRRHAPWLYLRLGRRCADSTMVEEAVQDTFVTVWNKARTWKGDGEVAAFIWGIGVRTLMARMRPRAPLLQRLSRRRTDDDPRAGLGITPVTEFPQVDTGAKREASGRRRLSQAAPKPDTQRSLGEHGDEGDEIGWMQGLSSRLSAYSLDTEPGEPVD